MAWISTQLDPNTPTGDLGYDDEFSVEGTAELHFLVLFDSLAEGWMHAINAAGVPLYGSVYSFGGEFHPLLKLKSKNAERLDDNSPIWRVSCQYNTLASEETDDPEDPELNLPEIGLRFEKKTEIIYVNRVRTGLSPITNSAGSIINDPVPTHEVSYPVLTITRNESIFRDVPGIARRYADAVNSDSYFGASAGECKIQSITANVERKKREDGSYQSYWKVTYEIAHREEGWKLTLLDTGPYYIDELRKIPFIDEYGHQYEGLLDGSGGQSETPVYLPSITHYPSLPYATLNLPEAAF